MIKIFLMLMILLPALACGALPSQTSIDEAEMRTCVEAGPHKCQLVLDSSTPSMYRLVNYHQFIDIDCDGVREVISQAEYETLSIGRWDEAGHCH